MERSRSVPGDLLLQGFSPVLEQGVMTALASIAFRRGIADSSRPLDDEYGSPICEIEHRAISVLNGLFGTPELPSEPGRGFMPKGKPVAGELIQWLQTLGPHLSLTGEHDSRFFCAGDLP